MTNVEKQKNDKCGIWSDTKVIKQKENCPDNKILHKIDILLLRY